MENKECFFTCECGGEILLVTRFEDEYDKEVYLSIYKYGLFSRKPNFLQRLKYCWYHLITGKKFEDEMILNFDKAKDLGKWLIENTK